MALSREHGNLHLTGIGSNEPVFIIRGADALAVRVIHYYIQLAKAEGIDEDTIGKLGLPEDLNTFEEYQEDFQTSLPGLEGWKVDELDT